jgi:hypothetical protein
VHEPLRLINDRLDDTRMRMADVGHGDAARHVEDASALGRDEPAPLPALDR